MLSFLGREVKSFNTLIKLDRGIEKINTIILAVINKKSPIDAEVRYSLYPDSLIVLNLNLKQNEAQRKPETRITIAMLAAEDDTPN